MTMESSNRNDRRTRAITAGLSATGAAAGAGGLAYAAHDMARSIRAGKKIPLKTKALIPLEVAGLGGEVMATHILHGDTKRAVVKAERKKATVAAAGGAAGVAGGAALALNGRFMSDRASNAVRNAGRRDAWRVKLIDDARREAMDSASIADHQRFLWRLGYQNDLHTLSPKNLVYQGEDALGRAQHEARIRDARARTAPDRVKQIQAEHEREARLHSGRLADINRKRQFFKPITPRVAQMTGRLYTTGRLMALGGTGLAVGSAIGGAAAAAHFARKKSSVAKADAAGGRNSGILAGCLQDLLADVVAMFKQAQLAHWNVTGPNFAAMHEFFGDLYADVYGSIDPIAENLRKIGVVVPASALAAPEVSSAGSDPQRLAAQLLATNAEVLESLQEAFDCADGHDGLQNFLAERIDMHEKWAWQLRSTVGGVEKALNPRQLSVLRRLMRSSDPEVAARARAAAKRDAHSLEDVRGWGRTRSYQEMQDRLAAEPPRVPRAMKRRYPNVDDASVAVSENSLLRLNAGRSVRKSMFDPRNGSGRRIAEVRKDRYFDAESDRQRRIGLYAGVLGGGAIAAGSQATGGNFKVARGVVDGRKTYGIRASRRGLVAAGIAGGLGLGSAAAYRRGISRRNQPWT